MSEHAPDMGFTALLAAAGEIAPDLPQNVLRKAYAIQRVHQFDRDRTESLQQMQRLIDEYVQASNPGQSSAESDA
jgi:hypothetical protein